MKRFLQFAALCCAGLFVMTSCTTVYTSDAAGFEKLQNDMKSKFGDDAYYSGFSVGYTPEGNSKGLTPTIEVTNDPESLMLEGWVYSSYAGWVNNTEITMEIPEDTEATEFLFQLDGQFDLKKLGELVELSAEKLAKEKNIENAQLSMATYSTGDGPVEDATIMILMQPENGGTNFTFQYDLDGELISFNY